MSNNYWTSKSNKTSPWKYLGISEKAKESEIRTAYKALALRHHPDKVDNAERPKATVRFQKLQAAYEHCINNAFDSKWATVEDVTEEATENYDFYWERDKQRPNAFKSNLGGKEDIDWRGKLPKGCGDFNTSWWKELTGDEPKPVRRWGKIRQWTQEHYGLKMSDAQTASIDTEYQTAKDAFEKWRRENIERRNEEDRLQADIDSTEPRVQERARAKLDELCATPDYRQYVACDADDHDDDNCEDNDSFFQSFISPIDKFDRVKAGPGLVQQGPGVNTSVPAHKRLAIFRSQAKALQTRQEKQGTEHEANMTRKVRRERAEKIKHIEEQLEKEVQVEEALKTRREKQAKASKRKAKELKWETTLRLVNVLRDVDDELKGYVRGVEVKVKDVPDKWEDAIAEE